ncbi:FixH family protein [Persicimonas caeni]|uniref:FixH family protein n=1 Tax=Persicimonas caeni TaxID=2292766 RepID=A0A4Y6PZI3_PERCE|nr:FixH family protein [Persicimonas caeni]QDG53682.1 FixH family protein [Persicimonas caeni]QED34903.1 FixH family protein [Persicimonas caeni]
MFGIPEKYFWPGLIITLLSSSVIWWTSMLFIAKSDGGPQVVDNYYQKSVDYEVTKASRLAAQKSGWTVDVAWTVAQDNTVELRFVDKSGAPISGLEGSVELRRPDRAGAFGSAKLEPVDGTPGSYMVQVAPDKPGLWDMVIDARQGSQDYRFEVREEVSL